MRKNINAGVYCPYMRGIKPKSIMSFRVEIDKRSVIEQLATAEGCALGDILRDCVDIGLAAKATESKV